MHVQYYVSARGVGVSFGAERKGVEVVDSEQSNRHFSYVRGFGGFCVCVLGFWLVLAFGLGLGTRRKETDGS